MLYNFELMMAGVILLSAMLAGGITLWYRRRKQKIEDLENEKQKELEENY